jgi:hypothetical protein
MRRREALGLIAWLEICTLCLGLHLLSSTTALALDVLDWRTNVSLVSADIKDGKLASLLEEITSITGWRIYVEPDVSHVVSAKFENVPPGEALRLLLGDLNFALIPEPNASPKLFVFRTTIGNATHRVVPSESVRSDRPEGVSPGRARRRDPADRSDRSNRANNHPSRIEEPKANWLPT